MFFLSLQFQNRFPDIPTAIKSPQNESFSQFIRIEFTYLHSRKKCMSKARYI